jgi:uncharacterized protein YbjT (DUF2867 family)
VLASAQAALDDAAVVSVVRRSTTVPAPFSFIARDQQPHRDTIEQAKFKVRVRVCARAVCCV